MTRRPVLLLPPHTENCLMSQQATGLSATSIDRLSLVEAIKNNRDAHIAEYGEAMTEYKKELHAKLIAINAKLTNALADVSNDSSGIVSAYEGVDMSVNLTKPRSFQKEYDRVLRRLAMAIDTHVVLTESEFNTYVCDEWSWKGDFMRSTAMYSKK